MYNCTSTVVQYSGTMGEGGPGGEVREGKSDGGRIGEMRREGRGREVIGR